MWSPSHQHEIWKETPLLRIPGFPDGSGGKESACNSGDLGSIPELGRSLGGGHGNPLQYSCLENPHGQRSLAGYSPWGHKESDRTDRLSTHTHTHTLRKVNKTGDRLTILFNQWIWNITIPFTLSSFYIFEIQCFFDSSSPSEFNLPHFKGTVATILNSACRCRQGCRCRQWWMKPSCCLSSQSSESSREDP